MEWDDATKALMNETADKAAEKAVTRTLSGLGVDISNPLEVQKDMQHVRSMRQTWENAKARGVVVAVGVILTALFAAAWAGFKSFVGGNAS